MTSDEAHRRLRFGTGTNFEAIADAIEAGPAERRKSRWSSPISQAPVIEKSAKRGIDVFAFHPKTIPSKPDYEREIIAHCQAHGVEWIALAGYMRLLSPVMLEAYDQRIVNIHPSLLPAFKGEDAIGQAIEYGVKVMGVTIHYVDASMDGGRIIAQRAFAVRPQWSRKKLKRRCMRSSMFCIGNVKNAGGGIKQWQKYW